jgi:hypothetical protein
MQNPYPTKILDIRPDGHQLLSAIPKFMEGDYDRLRGIDAIEVKAGPATLQPQVRDLNNVLIVTPSGILMFNHWPSAPIGLVRQLLSLTPIPDTLTERLWDSRRGMVLLAGDSVAKAG